MSDPYLGEIKLVSFDFAPKGWALCNGQLLPINQNQALFSILGTMYGGNGQTTFALPDLRGRMPIHQGGGYSVGQAAGETTHTLTIAEMPGHTHQPAATSTATGASPAGAAWATAPLPAYGAVPDTIMSAAALANAGGSLPHENQAPYLVLTFVIALTGVFPSRN